MDDEQLQSSRLAADPFVKPNDQTRLDFRSQKTQVRDVALGVTLSLGWDFLGVRFGVERTMRALASSSVELIKYTDDPASGIFADDQGGLNISKGESLFARCSHEVAASWAGGNSAKLALGGVDLAGEQRETVLLEVGMIGRSLEPNEGSTLGQFEQHCQSDFLEHQRALETDLARALRSKLIVKDTGDSRIEALQQVLRGEGAALEHRGRSYEMLPLDVFAENESVWVVGTLRQRRWLTDKEYGFRYGFLGDEARLVDFSINPRGTDDDAKTAQELSAFFARNAALWQRRQGEAFVVDTSLLP